MNSLARLWDLSTANQPAGSRKKARGQPGHTCLTRMSREGDGASRQAVTLFAGDRPSLISSASNLGRSKDTEATLSVSTYSEGIRQNCPCHGLLICGAAAAVAAAKF